MRTQVNPSYLANRAFESYRSRGVLGDGVTLKSVPAAELQTDTANFLAKIGTASNSVRSEPRSHGRLDVIGKR